MTEKKISITEAADWLREHDRYLVVTHKKPDGDTVGSAAALVRCLRKAGKAACLYRNPEITDKYMPFAEEYLADDVYTFENIVTVDTASLSQFAVGADIYGDRTDLAIDHHMSNTMYARLNCVEDRASCGEIIYDIALLLCGEIDRETANCLYTAVSTDTGCFAYGNTNAATLAAAAKIAEAGAELARLNKILFRTKRKSRAMLEGRLYSDMRYYFGGKAAAAAITLKMREETGVTEDDLDDVASIPIEIEGVEAGITLKEQTGEVKVSLRTGDKVDASAVCAMFGGGGHKQAAGCTLYCGMEEAETKIVEALGKVLN